MDYPVKIVNMEHDLIWKSENKREVRFGLYSGSQISCSTNKGTNPQRDLNYISTGTPQIRSLTHNEIFSSESGNHDSSKKTKDHTGICY